MADEQTHPRDSRTYSRQMPPHESALMSAVARKASEVGKAYERLYSAANPPEDTARARARRQAVQDIYHPCTAFFGEINKQARERQIPEGILVGIKRPLVRVYESMKAELYYLRQWIEEKAPPPLAQHVNVWACFIAVATRAQAAGLELTQDEQTALDFVRSKITEPTATP